MATVTETRSRTFPAAEIEAAIRGGLEEEAKDQADIRGTSRGGAQSGGYIEPEIDSMVAVTTLTRIDSLVAPLKADESLIRPGGYRSVDDCIRDILSKLERRWRKRQQEIA